MRCKITNKCPEMTHEAKEVYSQKTEFTKTLIRA